ncbi:MAG: InlB B-repeat-containing protein, partial [Clostridia bacterium]|nr:InlB B-repeat-containing protein [Clostridia bacterium]
MKTKRGLIIGVLALTAFSLSSISAVTVHAQTVEEQEQQQAAITTMADGFAFDGAAVQLVKVNEEYSHESSGLRFSFTLTKEAYDLANENGYSIGVLLVPKIVLDGAGRDASYITYENGKLASEASNTDVVKMELPLDKWTSKTVENVTTYSDYVYLYNFAPEQYNYEIYAKGYVYGVSEDVIYAEDPRGEGCRSIAYVCNGLIENADEYGYDDTMVTFLSGYLPTYTVSFMDGETVLSDTQVKYGNVVSVPETDPVKDGYIFDGWVDEKGEAFDFSKEITGATKVYASFKVGTIVLTQEMVDNGTFESTIEANMGGNFVLESDLDFSGKTTSPIGNASTHFTGTIDGQGYTIKNYVGGASTDNADGNVAARSFIAYVGAGGVVKNLGLEYTNQ